MAADKIVSPEKKPGFFDWLIKHSKKVMLILIIVSLVTSGALIGLVLYNNATTDPNVLATVGDEEITKSDLNEKIYSTDFGGTPENPTASVDNTKKKELLNELIEDKVVEIEAEKMGINVSEEEIKVEVLKRATKYDEQTDTQKSISRKSVKTGLLREKMKNKVLGSKEGSYILVNFSKNFSSDILATAEQKKKEDIDREARIKEDSDYAKDLIDSIYDEVKSGKITFKEGMEKAKNDPMFGVEGQKPMTVLQSDNFTYEDFNDKRKVFATDNESIIKNVGSLKAEEISKPFALKVNKSIDSASGTEQIDGIWIIVKVDRGNQSLAGSYDEWLEIKKKELNATILDKTLTFIKGSVFGKTAEAHYSSSHDCGSSNHWGVSGNTNNTGGLVVQTRYYTTSGAGPYYFNMNFNVFGTGGGVLENDSTGNVGILQNLAGKQFSTGSPIYYTGGSCSFTGYAVLGWGHTSGSGAYGHFGNRWSLHCGYNNFTANFIATAQGPGAYGGYWDNTSQTFPAVNGGTHWIAFNWHQNAAPADPTCSISVKQGSSSGTLLADGASIISDDTSPLTTCVGWSSTNTTSAQYEAFKSGSATAYYTEPFGTAGISNPWNTCSARKAIDGASTPYVFKLTVKNSAGVEKTCSTNLTINPSTSITTTCPTCNATPSSVRQGEPVTISWSGGTGAVTSLIQNPGATIANPTSGIQVLPSTSTSYSLMVQGRATACACNPVPVTVRPNQSGSEGPVPPN